MHLGTWHSLPFEIDKFITMKFMSFALIQGFIVNCMSHN